jgi:YihY family inner membrane protein
LSQIKHKNLDGYWLRVLIEDFRSIVWAIGQVIAQAKGPNQVNKRHIAGSLAFKTILALVPALAIVMAILANDAFSEKREQMLDQIVDAIYPVQTQTDSTFLDPDEPKNLQQLNKVGKQEIRISMKKFAVYSQKAGLFGFAGFLIVLFLLMRDIEHSFNFLWGLEKQRPLYLQMIRHTIFFIGLPILAFALLTLKGWVSYFDMSRPLIHAWFFSNFLPFLTVAAACAWMYLLLPNTKVDKRSAFLTGLLVSFLLEMARWLMNWYTLKIFERSHIYGALWMFPLILLWFYVSWTIILFGAELTYFVQKHRNHNNA